MFCRVGSGASSIFRAGRNQQRKAQQPAAKPKARPDVVKSKQDLLQELNRQAELNTLVLQREQAALRALQESQGYGLPARASVNAHLGSNGFGASQDVMGPPAGLQPLAVKAAKNHRFYDASPKAFSAAQGFADPAVRMHLIKELKQKQYKLELEQQIAEREATRQAAKAAAAAREAAEDAARAAAPPPWDPAARASRWAQSLASAAAAAGEQLSSQQLAAALQEVQQEQQLMWQEFTRQASALKQLLAGKRLSPSDSQQAWDELQRMRGVLGQAQEQQQALQHKYDQQQQQQQRSPRQRRSPPQRQQQQQQQQEPWLSQQHSTLHVSSQPLDLEQQQQQDGGLDDELAGDALDAFMVETKMVPVTVNSIPESSGVGSSLMQLMIPPAVLAADGSRLGQPVQHFNRYGGYGLDAELSGCSVASANLQARGGQASSSSAVFGGWQGKQRQQQQQGSQRPPASPPILRGDRFVDGRPEKQPAGSGTARAANHQQQQQQQRASPPRRANAGNAQAAKAPARGGRGTGGGAAGSAGKASNARRRV
ncbi:hypothetical protein OEZ85_003436 [Tetradesmus obliquus]|uniref:Uncharacterized protein n=1 Tax=Tetradesmus obliquus TaxID=3088 RepID=A0ABY8UBA2_TETOB|nr:hypothetical protein OEZ85_003436 [Tetradesmus obliquus]